MDKEVSSITGVIPFGHGRVTLSDNVKTMALCGNDAALRRNVNEWYTLVASLLWDWKRLYGTETALNEENKSLYLVAAELCGKPLPIAAGYADGGQLEPNPCKLGGMYAFCLVDVAGRVSYDECGLVLPKHAEPFDVVTNNFTELYAFLRMMRALPEGFAGELYSDSSATLNRVFRFKGDDTKFIDNLLLSVPRPFVSAIPKFVARLGDVWPILLAGHPTQGDLAKGYQQRGPREVPVSWFQHRCDLAMNDTRVRYERIIAQPVSATEAIEQAAETAQEAVVAPPEVAPRQDTKQPAQRPAMTQEIAARTIL